MAELRIYAPLQRPIVPWTAASNLISYTNTKSYQRINDCVAANMSDGSGSGAERLKTELRVQAWLRRCAVAGLMATVARKGDTDAGALFIKVNRFGAGCEVYSGTTAPDGAPAWLRATGAAPVNEKEADAYLARQAKYDQDLWVVEIEDPKAAFVLDAKIFDV